MTTTGSEPRNVGAAVYGAALLTVLLWSGTPIANKIALASVDAATVGLLRSALAGLLCGALAWYWRLPLPPTRRERRWLIFAGIASFAAWPLLLSIGLGMTTAGHAALMIATIPIFTGLMAALLERRRPGIAWSVGVVIALTGTVALVTMRTPDSGDANAHVWGDLVILIGVVACAAGYVAGGKLSPVIGTMATTLWSLAAACFVLVPAIALIWTRTVWAEVETNAWIAIAYMALFSSLLGYVAWFWALGRGGIARISAWQLSQPVATVALAAVVLGERVTPPLMIAGAAVLLGTALTQMPRRG